ncbi:anaphase-promoting complex subunit 1-like isoform X4 [Oncorhynchus kisutch]|uniref:anaphase-promoting complex subunit 1-like isoform X4 n=1 Tax=Oncorhynchus kisutch TaxID=8019 RepID=UPI0012DCF0E7|nr:anaphase-promoting complex subunit 1-like isoform X4 [Oncorhynchus kisutch]
MTSIGLLLGVSAAKLRNMDVSITTHLQSIHIPALLPPTSTELDVPHNVQVSAVLGIGLVFQDTGHRHDAEVCSLRSAQNHGLTEYYDQRLKNVPSVGVSGHQRGRHLSKSDPGYDLPEDQQQVYRRLAESSRHHVRPGLHSGSLALSPLPPQTLARCIIMCDEILPNSKAAMCRRMAGYKRQRWCV